MLVPLPILSLARHAPMISKTQYTGPQHKPGKTSDSNVVVCVLLCCLDVFVCVVVVVVVCCCWLRAPYTNRPSPILGVNNHYTQYAIKTTTRPLLFERLALPNAVDNDGKRCQNKSRDWKPAYAQPKAHGPDNDAGNHR